MFDTEKYLDSILASDTVPEAGAEDPEWPYVQKLREQDKLATTIRNRLQAIERQQQQLAAEARELGSRLERAAGACSALADVLVASAKARYARERDGAV